MRFGLFLAPYHHVDRNPTLSLRRDLELIQLAERLGFDEAWFGEHHSTGVEIIAAPELMVAAAAERTSRIMLGTGVISLPYHHPLIVADRMVLLDHLTRGRVIMGVGPGALPMDAVMMGIEPTEQRRMMEESLAAIVALLEGVEPVTRKTDWFDLRDARLQLRPFTRPHFELAVAALVSPTGPTIAARYGCSMLSMGSTIFQGFDVLEAHWNVYDERSRRFGRQPNRAGWRLVGPMHLARSLDEARADVGYGLKTWCDFWTQVVNLPILPEGATQRRSLADAVVDSQVGVIGTAREAIAQIERLRTQSGGFGTYLLAVNEWADPEATERSLRIFADEVMPAFQDTTTSRSASHDAVLSRRPEMLARAGEAVLRAVSQHAAEKEHEACEVGPRP